MPTTEPAATSAVPLSLYVHFPWCVQKCPYCDFNSHPLHGAVPENDYIDALIRDLAFELEIPEPRPLVSIFLGGGTPSLFSDRAIGRLLETAAARLAFAPDIEITLEANPGTVDAAHFRGYRAAGVNRLSIGVQSFDDAQLRRLGRIHDVAAAHAAIETARAAGFDNLNLDLMYALPEQSVGEAVADLRAGLAAGPEHLSWYQLTLEPNTAFGQKPPPLPDDDGAWAMQQAGQALLAASGLLQYEVSAYARAGRASRHNRNYWTFGDYIGIGSGAHGKRTDTGGIGAGAHAKRGVAGTILRRARHKHPRRYLETAGSAAALQEERSVTAAELPFEYVMNALRLEEGFTFDAFERATGLPRATLEPALTRARVRGLLEAGNDCARPSALGRAHLNALIGEFLP